jgi:hypothetical protein
MADPLTNILQAIILIGLFILGIWTKRWILALNGEIAALKGTVDAQSQIIAAQNTLLTNLGTVLNAADTPKMLERVEAYKKFVDHEKEVWMNQIKRELTETQSSQHQVMHLNELVTSIAGVLAGILPFVPPEVRAKFLDELSNDISPQLNDRLHHFARVAPDLSLPEARRGLGYAGYLINIGRKRSD